MADEQEQGRGFTVAEAVALAIQAQRDGHLAAAAEIYRRVLAADPENADALHFSGLLAFQHGDRDKGARLVERSLELAPGHPDFWNNHGNLLKALGKKSGAADACRRAIALRPGFADAHSNLGNILDAAGDTAGAEKEYRAAIAADPAHADAHFNLALLLESAKRADAACEEYARVIELRPGESGASARLANIRWHQQRFDEAVGILARNAERNPADPEAHVLLGGLLWDRKRTDESLASLHRAITLDPAHANASRTLVSILNILGRKTDAAEVCRRWVAADPGNPIPRHYLAASAGAQAPARAPDDYVVRVFDRFASTFDEKLGDLDYRAPQLVAAALAAAHGGPRAALDILDAGCGTGLCAPLLRPFARCLDGVDLSPGMLERARERGGYDDLQAAELTAFLAALTAEYDAIVSADTLCYFGDLGAVVRAAAAALRPGGALIFTVEKCADTAAPGGFTLDHTGRYTHTEAHVRAALADAGFDVRSLEDAVLRMERFKPVDGLVVTARKNP